MINKLETLKELTDKMSNEVSSDDRPNCAEILKGVDIWCLHDIPTKNFEPKNLKSEYNSMKKFLMFHLHHFPHSIFRRGRVSGLIEFYNDLSQSGINRAK